MKGISGLSGTTGIWVVLAVAGVAVLVAVASALVRRARPTSRPAPRPSGPTGPRPRPATKGGPGPAPQEIWWAEVPFEDGPGSKDRPCLVLRVNGRTATVAKITSKHHAERPGVLPLPPGSVGDRQGRTSWLETDELRQVPLSAFRRRAGTVDRQVWAHAQRALQTN
ncbi:type II toxin-antitoxin system PemK/MazF family toxin [Kitasatospora aureofaciens]|uniref:type II toxin-antitoxin system PemK/MazF family toxin n=1 Tax=Kitasatospora aureofaciens TaxID=1894 RepID=UPI001C486047|nr:type II toxin-antitoxin system PemK/MazF family toxin [Kitasatospora aureofaciens]MBV6698427.1 type II toxin-antitoxin system PemK/MazF family toxin [Kitasatospora aureofaciens]